MANLSKIKRDKMIAFLEQLKELHSDDESIRAFNEIENQLRDKKYGLVWEEHSETVDEMLEENIPVFCADPERRLCKDPSLPWNFIIEGDNLQALYLLEKTHRGKVDCIYIDPPYNTGAHDWKYNNDYVGKEDAYRHSKWLSMMKNRLVLARHLLNPEESVLICTIDEKEYLHFDPFNRDYRMSFKGELRHTVALGTDAFGNIQRLDNLMEAMPDKLNVCRAQLDNERTQLENAKAEVQKPFPREEELKTKSARLAELNALLDMDKRENEIVDGEREDGETVPQRHNARDER